MPGHSSNADRIARAAAESEAAVKELTAKRAATTARAVKAARKPRTPPVPPRVKVVWAVGRTGAAPLKSYPYAERAAADAEAARIGKGCVVHPIKVPME